MTPKFRAWHAGSKRLYEVVGMNFIEREIVVFDPRNDYTIYPDLHSSEVVLLRSTGLTDTAGKEIYAGDILESKDGRRIVIVDKGLHFEADSGDYGLVLCPGHVEGKRIVGNVYENGELVSDD